MLLAGWLDGYTSFCISPALCGSFKHVTLQRHGLAVTVRKLLQRHGLAVTVRKLQILRDRFDSQLEPFAFDVYYPVAAYFIFVLYI